MTSSCRVVSPTPRERRCLVAGLVEIPELLIPLVVRDRGRARVVVRMCVGDVQPLDRMAAAAAVRGQAASERRTCWEPTALRRRPRRGRRARSRGPAASFARTGLSARSRRIQDQQPRGFRRHPSSTTRVRRLPDGDGGRQLRNGHPCSVTGRRRGTRWFGPARLPQQRPALNACRVGSWRFETSWLKSRGKSRSGN